MKLGNHWGTIGLVFFDGQAVEYLSVELVENGEPH